MDRIRAALRRGRLWTPKLDSELARRVRIVCGDLAKPNMGLRFEERKSLTRQVQAVFHNAALVNYVLNYGTLKPHNVDATRALLQFAFAGTRKEFHLISSTIIFGWTAKRMLLEIDTNNRMANLDFGYAQSKWVAEQLVFAAEKQGLRVRVYRPSFLSASTNGSGSRDDIAILLLAFMINHEIAVKALNEISFIPADIAADNIASIFKQCRTGGTLHVTADDYYNMEDVTRLITSEYGYPFVYYDIPTFAAHVKQLCTKDDPLYPLLNFFMRSYPKIAAMQHKRYNNDRFREAREQSGNCRNDAGLKDTVSYLMQYMLREEIISGSPSSIAQRRNLDKS